MKGRCSFNAHLRIGLTRDGNGEAYADRGRGGGALPRPEAARVRRSHSVFAYRSYGACLVSLRDARLATFWESTMFNTIEDTEVSRVGSKGLLALVVSLFALSTGCQSPPAAPSEHTSIKTPDTATPSPPSTDVRPIAIAVDTWDERAWSKACVDKLKSIPRRSFSGGMRDFAEPLCECVATEVHGFKGDRESVAGQILAEFETLFHRSRRAPPSDAKDIVMGCRLHPSG